MNRGGTGESYLELLDRIRDVLPDAVIRSTFLTGFPGETEDDFAMLVDFQQKARFDWLGVFVYSREEGTPAYSMGQRVAKKTAEGRKAVIEENQIPITEKRMDRFVGRRMEVLVEEKIDGSFCLGRLFCQAPEVDGAAIIHTGTASGVSPAVRKTAFKTAPVLNAGDLVPCRVLRRAGFDLEVEPDGLS
jgi:ribosomal protein S12 methylthiotransferase